MTETPARWKLVEVPSRAVQGNRQVEHPMRCAKFAWLSSLGRSLSVIRGTNRRLKIAQEICRAVGDREGCIYTANEGGTAGKHPVPF